MTRDLLTYQIIIILISVLLIARTFWLVLKSKKSLRELFLAVVIWGAFATISLFPNLISSVSKLLGFELGSNAIFTFSIILLFYIVLRMSLRIDKQESNITKLTRAIALEKIKIKK